MSFLNVEIKAGCNNPEVIHALLLEQRADFKGTDFQTDTYFNVPNGRLKLREGNIENNLIYYERDNQPGPKSSHFQLFPVSSPDLLKDVLTKSCGIKVIVRKKRRIYFIENVKFHLDEVTDLGSFVEIEAGNKGYDRSPGRLREQCDFYLQQFQIKPDQLIALSYSDLLMAAALSKTTG